MASTRLAAVSLGLVGWLIVACGAENADSVGTSGDSALTIIVVDGPGAKPRTWDLACDPVGGTHPDPARACAAILAAPGDPFAPVPPDAICTEIYGGPQEAFVKGYWQGERIDATFTRQNGCEIARWDRLLGLFGTPIPPIRE